MGRYKSQVVRFVLTIILLPAVACDVGPPVLNPSILSQSRTEIGDCQACKLFVESFKAGLERTARGKYEGGDTAWEEEKLKKSYKRSEMRLIDIQDAVCREMNKYSVNCHHMAEKAETFIEEWWMQDPDDSEDLYTYICVDKIKVCCPKHHYGKDCSPCLGDPEKLCSGNGKCRGDGTRKGNGTCLCDKGYAGDNCDQCAIEYFLTYSDENKILCAPCHISCIGGCTAGTKKNCRACKPGFTFYSDEGCLDINECDNVDRCKNNEYCINLPGSYACMKCHKACNGCYGDGLDMCRKCAIEYSKKGEFCVADRENEIDPSTTMTSAR